MTPASPNLPRIGIPWRTSQEEGEQLRPKVQDYENAVREAGGEPVLLSLQAGATLNDQLASLDGFLLPGSPADVEPKEYGASNQGKSEPPDLPRERTDRAILEHAFAEKKPVLAICYGCQLLNVYLGGTLIQDLRSETGTTTAHRKKDVWPIALSDPKHEVRFEPGSRLAEMAGESYALVNSSHHQSVDQPGASVAHHGQGERRNCGKCGMDWQRELGDRCAMASRAHDGRPIGAAALFGIGQGGEVGHKGWHG